MTLDGLAVVLNEVQPLKEKFTIIIFTLSLYWFEKNAHLQTGLSVLRALSEQTHVLLTVPFSLVSQSPAIRENYKHYYQPLDTV